MAKKTHSGRSSTAAHRPTSAKATLVRSASANGASATVVAPEAKTSDVTVAPSANTKRAIPVANRASAPRATPSQPLPSKASRPVAPPVSAAAARANSAQHARTMTAASQTTSRRAQIRAENYAYVKRDLALIGIVAFLMFAFMVVLHFVLPA